MQKLPKSVVSKSAEQPDRRRLRSPGMSRHLRKVAIDDNTLAPIDICESMLAAAQKISQTSGQHVMISRQGDDSTGLLSAKGKESTMHLVTQERLVEMQMARERIRVRLSACLEGSELMPGDQVMVKTGFVTDGSDGPTVVMPGDHGYLDELDDGGNGFINFEGHCQWVPRSNITRGRCSIRKAQRD